MEKKLKKYLLKFRDSLPYLGKLIRDRDELLKQRNSVVNERNKLLIELGRYPEKGDIFTNPTTPEIVEKRNKHKVTNRDKELIGVAVGGLKIENNFYADNMGNYLKGKKTVFDVGSGPMGSYWWKMVDKDAEIVGIDLNYFPKKIPSNVTIYKFDASKLHSINRSAKAFRLVYLAGKKIFIKKNIKWLKRFDMVVANHVLEHVSSPKKTIKGIAKILKKGGLAYIAIPDSRNFLDIFYHVLFQDGGGHISFITNEMIYRYFRDSGFKLLSCTAWPNNWSWLRDAYEVKKGDIPYLNRNDFDYLTRCFEKEMSSNHGYYYGWEMVFKKIL